jgi:membrane dipeptidase
LFGRTPWFTYGAKKGETMSFNLKKFTITSMSLSALLLSACAHIDENTPLDSSIVHDEVLTLDTHVDIPLTYMGEVDPGTDTDAQVDIGKMETGGLDAAFFIIYTPQGDLNAEGFAVRSQN